MLARSPHAAAGEKPRARARYVLPIARAVLLAAALGARPAGAAVQLLVEAPPELAAAAAEIRSYGATTFTPVLERTGLADAGEPIRILLFAESSRPARGTPPWISGSTDSRAGLVVLFPARVPGYPDRGLEALVQHVRHFVLVARAARGHAVPRWFDEGLAMAAGRAGDLGDRARLALAVLSDDRLPLARIDAAFAGGSAEVASAYALARDFYAELESRFGHDVGARILAGLARGESFKQAFLAATGRSLSAVEIAYWKRRTFWDRWFPIVTSSAALWGGITLLALAAFRRRRAIDAELRRKWEAERLEGTAGAPATAELDEAADADGGNDREPRD